MLDIRSVPRRVSFQALPYRTVVKLQDTGRTDKPAFITGRAGGSGSAGLAHFSRFSGRLDRTAKAHSPKGKSTSTCRCNVRSRSCASWRAAIADGCLPRQVRRRECFANIRRSSAVDIGFPQWRMGLWASSRPSTGTYNGHWTVQFCLKPVRCSTSTYRPKRTLRTAGSYVGSVAEGSRWHGQVRQPNCRYFNE
ncbi:hypothetical protein ABH945_004606 [Paraburkholderia sp. GAS333]